MENIGALGLILLVITGFAFFGWIAFEILTSPTEDEIESEHEEAV